MKTKLIHGWSFIRLLLPAMLAFSALAADVSTYTVGKSQVFVQNSANAPVLSLDGPFRFEARVKGSGPNSMNSASLMLPNGQSKVLAGDSNGDDFKVNESWSSAAMLEMACGSGNFTFVVNTVHEGQRVMSLNLPSRQYPVAPHVNNFTTAQAINSAADFTLNWDAFFGGTANDFIDLWIEDNSNFDDSVFSMPPPGSPGALNGLSTSAVIPQGTLAPGHTYTAHLSFYTLTAVNTTAYPGAKGLAGIGSETTFTLQTASGNPTGTPDVSFFFVGKAQAYVQTGNNAPGLRPDWPFEINAFAKVTSPGAVTSVIAQKPGDDASKLLDWDPESMEFRAEGQEFASKSEMDSRFPSGNYSMTFNAVHDGTRKVTLYLAPDAYPNPPFISNMAAAQSVNAGTDFTLTWQPFSAGTPSDYVQVQVRDAQDNKVFESPFIGLTGALSGINTSVVIPHNTLNPGTTYNASILFVKVLLRDTTSYPGVLGAAGYLTMTEFTLQTWSGNPTGPADVSLVHLGKSKAWVQTSSGSPVAAPNDTFELGAYVVPTAANTVNSASVLIPGGLSQTLTWSGNNQQLRFKAASTSKTTLDAQYANGNYVFSINAVHDGSRTVSLSLVGDAYTNPPQISNFDAAQAVNPGADFVLNWLPFIGGTANDMIVLSIDDSVNGTVFRTPLLDDSLNGTATSCLIPANTLVANRQYNVTLNFVKITVRDTTSYPGVACLAGFGAYTDFPIQTTSGNPTGTPDVSFFFLGKTRNYQQNDAGNPIPSGHHSFNVLVKPTTVNSMTGASVTLPNNATRVLTWNDNMAGYTFYESAASEAALDATYPAGTYRLTINTVHDGVKTLTLNLPASTYPAPGHVNNFTAAQSVDSASSFNLSWDPFVGGTSLDVINAEVYDTQGNVVYRAPTLGPGQFDGTVRAWFIPAGTLGPQQTYRADLYFLKLVSFDNSSYPGAVGSVGFMTDTEFDLATSTVATNPDVAFYGINKGRIFAQTNEAAPVLGSGKPYFGGAVVVPTATNSVAGATLQLPIGFSKPLTWSANNNMFVLTDYFADKTSLDALYGTGNYTVSINAIHDGTRNLTMTMPEDQYPPPAQISNFNAAQAVDAAGPFTLFWNPVNGATLNDRIRFYLYDSQSHLVFFTQDQLEGTRTSVIIPANTMTPGQSYRGMLFFIKIAVPGNNAYTGVSSDVSFYARTDFSMRAAAPTGPKFASIQMLADGSRRLQINGVAGRNIRLEATTDFVSWSSLGTMNVPADPANFFDGEVPALAYRFYRVVIP